MMEDKSNKRVKRKGHSKSSKQSASKQVDERIVDILEPYLKYQAKRLGEDVKVQILNITDIHERIHAKDDTQKVDDDSSDKIPTKSQSLNINSVTEPNGAPVSKERGHKHKSKRVKTQKTNPEVVEPDPCVEGSVLEKKTKHKRRKKHKETDELVIPEETKFLEQKLSKQPQNSNEFSKQNEPEDTSKHAKTLKAKLEVLEVDPCVEQKKKKHKKHRRHKETYNLSDETKLLEQKQANGNAKSSYRCKSYSPQTEQTQLNSLVEGKNKLEKKVHKKGGKQENTNKVTKDHVSESETSIQKKEKPKHEDLKRYITAIQKKLDSILPRTPRLIDKFKDEESKKGRDRKSDKSKEKDDEHHKKKDKTREIKDEERTKKQEKSKAKAETEEPVKKSEKSKIKEASEDLHKKQDKEVTEHKKKKKRHSVKEDSIEEDTRNKSLSTPVQMYYCYGEDFKQSADQDTTIEQSEEPQRHKKRRKTKPKQNLEDNNAPPTVEEKPEQIKKHHSKHHKKIKPVDTAQPDVNWILATVPKIEKRQKENDVDEAKKIMAQAGHSYKLEAIRPPLSPERRRKKKAPRRTVSIMAVPPQNDSVDNVDQKMRTDLYKKYYKYSSRQQDKDIVSDDVNEASDSNRVQIEASEPPSSRGNESIDSVRLGKNTVKRGKIKIQISSSGCNFKGLSETRLNNIVQELGQLLRMDNCDRRTKIKDAETGVQSCKDSSTYFSHSPVGREIPTVKKKHTQDSSTCCSMTEQTMMQAASKDQKRRDSGTFCNIDPIVNNVQIVNRFKKNSRDSSTNCSPIKKEIQITIKDKSSGTYNRKPVEKDIQISEIDLTKDILTEEQMVDHWPLAKDASVGPIEHELRMDGSEIMVFKNAKYSDASQTPTDNATIPSTKEAFSDEPTNSPLSNCSPVSKCSPIKRCVVKPKVPLVRSPLKAKRQPIVKPVEKRLYNPEVKKDMKKVYSRQLPGPHYATVFDIDSIGRSRLKQRQSQQLPVQQTSEKPQDSCINNDKLEVIDTEKTIVDAEPIYPVVNEEENLEDEEKNEENSEEQPNILEEKIEIYENKAGPVIEKVKSKSLSPSRNAFDHFWYMESTVNSKAKPSSKSQPTSPEKFQPSFNKESKIEPINPSQGEKNYGRFWHHIQNSRTITPKTEIKSIKSRLLSPVGNFYGDVAEVEPKAAPTMKQTVKEASPIKTQTLFKTNIKVEEKSLPNKLKFFKPTFEIVNVGRIRTKQKSPQKPKNNAIKPKKESKQITKSKTDLDFKLKPSLAKISPSRSKSATNISQGQRHVPHSHLPSPTTSSSPKKRHISRIPALKANLKSKDKPDQSTKVKFSRSKSDFSPREFSKRSRSSIGDSSNLRSKSAKPSFPPSRDRSFERPPSANCKIQKLNELSAFQRRKAYDESRRKKLKNQPAKIPNQLFDVLFVTMVDKEKSVPHVEIEAKSNCSMVICCSPQQTLSSGKLLNKIVKSELDLTSFKTNSKEPLVRSKTELDLKPQIKVASVSIETIPFLNLDKPPTSKQILNKKKNTAVGDDCIRNTRVQDLQTDEKHLSSISVNTSELKVHKSVLSTIIDEEVEKSSVTTMTLPSRHLVHSCTSPISLITSNDHTQASTSEMTSSTSANNLENMANLDTFKKLVGCLTTKKETTPREKMEELQSVVEFLCQTFLPKPESTSSVEPTKKEELSNTSSGKTTTDCSSTEPTLKEDDDIKVLKPVSKPAVKCASLKSARNDLSNRLSCPELASNTSSFEFLYEKSSDESSVFDVSPTILPPQTVKPKKDATVSCVFDKPSMDSQRSPISEESGYTSGKSKRHSMTNFFKKSSILALFKPVCSKDKLKRGVSDDFLAVANVRCDKDDSITINSLDTQFNAGTKGELKIMDRTEEQKADFCSLHCSHAYKASVARKTSKSQCR